MKETAQQKAPSPSPAFRPPFSFLCIHPLSKRDLIYIIVSNSNYDSDFNKSVTFPTTSYTGAASFTASLESLYGVQYEPVLAPFNVSITVGEETSKEYVFVGLS